MKKTISAKQILAVTSVLELFTGLALIATPELVIKLLLGVSGTGLDPVLGRVFGVALLALGLACWPDRRGESPRPAAWRGMLAYNVLIALYLAFLGTARHFTGMFLWPAVILHAVVAVLLAWLPQASQKTG